MFVEHLGAPWSSGACDPGPNGPVVNPPLYTKKKSVILSGPRDGGRYKREDFLEGLEYILQGKIKDSVIILGPLAKNSEWYLVLKDHATKDTLMLASYVTVKEADFRIRSADSSQFIVRLLWAIPFIPSSAIAKSLNDLCNHTHVLSIVDEKLLQKGFEGVATGVRSIVMTGDSREVPHIMHVVNPTTCETYELLLTMVGRLMSGASANCFCFTSKHHVS